MLASAHYVIMSQKEKAEYKETQRFPESTLVRLRKHFLFIGVLLMLQWV